MQYYHLFKKLLSDEYLKLSREKELEDIDNKYNKQEYEEIMQYIVNLNMHYTNKNLITSQSIKLANKLKEQLDINVFPIVIRQYLGSTTNDIGYFTWHMFDKNMFRIGSQFPVKTLLLKKNQLVELQDSLTSTEILFESK